MKELILTKPYDLGARNDLTPDMQMIRITQGCPNQCPYCGEPQEPEVFPIPRIERNFVRIYDMNLLSKPEAKTIIQFLGTRRVDGKVVRYELTCGIDYRFLMQELANLLKQNRFVNIRLAWDWGLDQQYKVKDAIDMLVNAGYPSKSIMVFIICNWRIPYEDCLRKMELCKIWRVKIGDCWYDNQLAPNVEPRFWTEEQIKDFRRRVRKHNQMVLFGIDPELEITHKRGG